MVYFYLEELGFKSQSFNIQTVLVYSDSFFKVKLYAQAILPSFFKNVYTTESHRMPSSYQCWYINNSWLKPFSWYCQENSMIHPVKSPGVENEGVFALL